jgi:LAO/AO transport system kinase
MSGINPRIKVRAKSSQSIDYYVDGLKRGDRYILSECITLVESTHSKDDQLRLDLLKYATQQKSASRRIAITGSPGAGKSTLIEALGSSFITAGDDVAVLAIDPSSSQSGGSILGDKTRMQALSQATGAYIRPTAAGKTLGGTARHTKEAMTLCEAAGFDTIIIETVGVGQSETEVAGIVDMMLVVLLPGAGDEVQGIKRGIMEMADLLIINKADGDRLSLAHDTMLAYRSALSLLPRRHDTWRPKAIKVSALHKEGLDKITAAVTTYYTTLGGEAIDRLRLEQDAKWYRYQVERIIIDRFLKDPTYAQIVNDCMTDIVQADIDAFTALDQTINQILGA